MDGFCRALPKVELHAHLNGSLRDGVKWYNKKIPWKLLRIAEVWRKHTILDLGNPTLLLPRICTSYTVLPIKSQILFPIPLLLIPFNRLIESDPTTKPGCRLGWGFLPYRIWDSTERNTLPYADFLSLVDFRVNHSRVYNTYSRRFSIEFPFW